MEEVDGGHRSPGGDHMKPETKLADSEVLAVLHPRDGFVIQQVTRALCGEDPGYACQVQIKLALTSLHRAGRIETYRERSGSPLHYRKPEPLDWPQLATLTEMAAATLEQDPNLIPHVRHQLKTAVEKIDAMIESHAAIVAEQLQDWVAAECIWRVEFNKAHGQTPRVNYVEASEGDTKQDVRRWHMCAPIVFDVYVVDCRRADESDVDELLEMTREEEGW